MPIISVNLSNRANDIVSSIEVGSKSRIINNMILEYFNTTEGLASLISETKAKLNRFEAMKDKVDARAKAKSERKFSELSPDEKDAMLKDALERSKSKKVKVNNN